jgi:hypothetical protein
VDTDSAADWWPQPAPSPGRAGAKPEGPPPVRLNEILPSPGRIDWDGSGASDHQDEWVELYNGAKYAVDLGGWWLEDREEGEGGWRYRFPDGLKLKAGGFHVAYRRDTGIALRGEGETLRLYRPEGVEADRFHWAQNAGRDRSWSRSVDGGGEWTRDYAVTPGRANVPEPPKKKDKSSDEAASGVARAVGIGELRDLSPGTLVRVSGRVTAPPGVFGPKTLYIEDAAAGVQVYLGARGQALPFFAMGESVTAVGRLKDYHGEREIVVGVADDVYRSTPDPGVAIGRVARLAPPSPLEQPTGAIGEAVEGRLVRVSGAVVGFGGPTLTLDDGSGPVRILVRDSTGIRRPWVEKGEWMTVAGIAGQYAKAAPWEGGYRLMPRFASDFGDAAIVDAESVVQDGRLPWGALAKVLRGSCRAIVVHRRQPQ